MCGNWHKLVSILAWKSYRLVCDNFHNKQIYFEKKMQANSFSSNELLFLIGKKVISKQNTFEVE